MTEDDKGLPASIAGLFGTAIGLYARRFPLYAILAVLAISVQYAVDTLAVASPGLMIGLDIIVGSFIAATVSIGVAFDLAMKEADWSRIVTAASLRWGVVTIVAGVAFCVSLLFSPFLTVPPDQTAFGLLLLPFIVLWGGTWMGTVPAAIEPVQTRLFLPLMALGKGLAVSTRFANVGRLMVFSVLLLLPLVLEFALNNVLSARHITNAPFWANVPIDMLATGPLQAVATVFYVDFLRRAKR